MKHFKVRVQYLNGIDFLFECDAVTGWQAGALARVAGRLAGMGGSIDVKETIVQEKCLNDDYEKKGWGASQIERWLRTRERGQEKNSVNAGLVVGQRQ